MAQAEVVSVSADTWLETFGGELWVVENHTAHEGNKALIIYNMCDRNTLYDDEIIRVLYF